MTVGKQDIIFMHQFQHPNITSNSI